MISNVLENLSKLVRKSSQNTSKIDLEGGLEAAREPPLCGGDPKTSFWAILAPLWDPIWRPFLAHFGHRFLMPSMLPSSIYFISSKGDVFLICLLDGILGDLGSGRAPGPHFGYLASLLGSLLETISRLALRRRVLL